LYLFAAGKKPGAGKDCLLEAAKSRKKGDFLWFFLSEKGAG